MKPTKILVSWYHDPRYIPPFVLSTSQTNVGPRIYQDQPLLCYAGWTPIGSYDLHHVVTRQSLNAGFDLVVVMTDASRVNMPFNVRAFGAPTVLCVGDTHHMKQPLQGLTDYALRSGYDFLVLPYNRQHLHWFVEAGCQKVAWLPGLTASAQEGKFLTNRKPQVAFAGHATAQSHPRRYSLLLHMLKSVPLDAAQRLLIDSLQLYAASQLSFNCSLNGDLNMRIFEILGAGGCLLTDRLAQQSGLHLLLCEDEEYLAYGTADELIEKCHQMLRDPAAALEIARRGFAAYARKLNPQYRVRDLLEWVNNGRLDALFLPDVGNAKSGHRLSGELKSRLSVYEVLQERHRLFDRQRVLIDATLPPTYCTDASDLTRLEVATVDLQSEKAQNVSCDILVIGRGKTVPSWLRATVVLDTPTGQVAKP